MVEFDKISVGKIRLRSYVKNTPAPRDQEVPHNRKRPKKQYRSEIERVTEENNKKMSGEYK